MVTYAPVAQLDRAPGFEPRHLFTEIPDYKR